MTKKISKDTFENKLNRLEEISHLLESDDIGLEDAMALYKEGIELSNDCISALKVAELKITQLKKNLDTLTTEEENFFEE
ncbi:MAG: exodeoxyribonuclease VII small subunit [Ignavibacteriaceae bacterium]